MSEQAPLEYGTQDTVEEGSQDPPDAEDDYVLSTGEFHSRLKYWLATLNITSMYPVQLAIVFKAGATINLHQIQKEGRKFKETATKYKSLCDDLHRRNILSALEHDSMKTLKHITTEKEDTVVEITDWPSGKSIWDRYMKCRRTIRSMIGPLIPKDLTETPSGTGLKKAFEKVAFKLYTDPKLNTAYKKMSVEERQVKDNPHDALLQGEIDKKITKPFNLLLTARIFFDSPLLKADVKMAQDAKNVQSRAQMKKEANMKRAAKVAAADKEKRDREDAEKQMELKRQRHNDHKCPACRQLFAPGGSTQA